MLAGQHTYTHSSAMWSFVIKIYAFTKAALLQHVIGQPLPPPEAPSLYSQTCLVIPHAGAQSTANLLAATKTDSLLILCRSREPPAGLKPTHHSCSMQGEPKGWQLVEQYTHSHHACQYSGTDLASSGTAGQEVVRSKPSIKTPVSFQPYYPDPSSLLMAY